MLNRLNVKRCKITVKSYSSYPNRLRFAAGNSEMPPHPMTHSKNYLIRFITEIMWKPLWCHCHQRWVLVKPPPFENPPSVINLNVLEHKSRHFEKCLSVNVNGRHTSYKKCVPHLPGTTVVFSTPPGRTTVRVRSWSRRFSFWSMLGWG